MGRSWSGALFGLVCVRLGRWEPALAPDKALRGCGQSLVGCWACFGARFAAQSLVCWPGAHGRWDRGGRRFGAGGGVAGALALGAVLGLCLLLCFDAGRGEGLWCAGGQS